MWQVAVTSVDSGKLVARGQLRLANVLLTAPLLDRFGQPLHRPGGDRPEEVRTVGHPYGDLAAIGHPGARTDGGGGLHGGRVDPAVHHSPRGVMLRAQLYLPAHPRARDLGEGQADGLDERAAEHVEA